MTGQRLRAPRPAGLYVHVLFCLTRCGYCDFNTYAGLDHLKGRYLGALRREAGLAAPTWSGTRFVSVFLGGGTPTTLPSASLVKLLDDLRSAFTVDRPAEIVLRARAGEQLGLFVEGAREAARVLHREAPQPRLRQQLVADRAHRQIGNPVPRDGRWRKPWRSARSTFPVTP